MKKSIIYYIFIPILILSFLLLSCSEGKTVSTIEDKNSFDAIEEIKTSQETSTENITTEENIEEETIEVIVEENTLNEETTIEDYAPEYVNAICTEVIDGDTIVIQEESTGKLYKVRYIGINCPDKGDPYYDEAKKVNEELVLGKTLKLEKDVSETDRYNRLLRYVYVDSIFVNAYLVEQGYAQVATYPPDVKFSETFLSLQREAEGAGRGLWGIQVTDITETKTKEEDTISSGTIAKEPNANAVTLTETAPPETTPEENPEIMQPVTGQFVGSINSDVYHYLNCHYVKRIKEYNKIYFTSVEDAKAHGYRPCKVCGPPG